MRAILTVAAAALLLPRGGLVAADPGPARLEVAARRAVRWLLERQRPDGSWRSEHYGVLRSGQAYTAFVLHTLLVAPAVAGPVPREAVDRALGFLRAHAGDDGALGYHDPDVLEYPVYATSYALRAFVIAAPRDPLVPKMAAWLAGMQLAESKGFDPVSPAYGGWSFGVTTLPKGTPGHTDLAHTRRALQALAEAKSLDAATAAKALRVLGLLQKREPEIARFPGVPGFAGGGVVPSDGGFFFSPVVLVANKALHETPTAGLSAHFRSYATATADGALALIAAGVPRSDPRVVAARSWLEGNDGVEIAGIPANHPEPWAAGMRFYHLAAFTEAAASLALGGTWRDRFGSRIAALARPDGSYANDASAIMKEDDPVLATALALSAATSVLTSEDV